MLPFEDYLNALNIKPGECSTIAPATGTSHNESANEAMGATQDAKLKQDLHTEKKESHSADLFSNLHHDNNVESKGSSLSVQESAATAVMWNDQTSIDPGS